MNIIPTHGKSPDWKDKFSCLANIQCCFSTALIMFTILMEVQTAHARVRHPGLNPISNACQHVEEHEQYLRENGLTEGEEPPDHNHEEDDPLYAGVGYFRVFPEFTSFLVLNDADHGAKGSGEWERIQVEIEVVPPRFEFRQDWLYYWNTTEGMLPRERSKVGTQVIINQDGESGSSVDDGDYIRVGSMDGMFGPDGWSNYMGDYPCTARSPREHFVYAQAGDVLQFHFQAVEDDTAKYDIGSVVMRLRMPSRIPIDDDRYDSCEVADRIEGINTFSWQIPDRPTVFGNWYSEEFGPSDSLGFAPSSRGSDYSFRRTRWALFDSDLGSGRLPIRFEDFQDRDAEAYALPVRGEICIERGWWRNPR